MTRPKPSLLSLLSRRVAYMVSGALLGVLPLLATLSVPLVEAHNLQTKMVYMYFDGVTQDMLDARIADPGFTPPDPLLRVGDEIGMVIKVVPRDGTTTGVTADSVDAGGCHTTVYGLGLEFVKHSGCLSTVASMEQRS